MSGFASPASVPVPDRPIAVLGAGTLGRRIALMFAARNGEVRIFDSSHDQQIAALDFVARQLPRVVEELPGGAAACVVASPTLATAVSDAWLVIEALPEHLDLKCEIFAKLDRLAPPDAILATNSSSYPSSQMIGGLERPERIVNTHFMMPPVNNAVEIMSCGETHPAVIARLMTVLPAYGLVPFEVRAESMGLIFNRIWAAIKRESLAVVADGAATPEDVDRIFTLCLGARYGPFRMMDAVGLDVVLDIEEHYAKVRAGVPEAPRALLRHYIAEGRLGRKSGNGFYDDYPALGEASIQS